MTRFLEIKSVNPKLKQNQIAKQLGCSSINLQLYGIDKKMLSLYTIPSNSHKRKQQISNREHDLERPQMTSKESSPKNENDKLKKNQLKGGGNIEIIDEKLDEILNNNNI